MSELGRQLNFQTMVACALFKSQNRRSAVDMTLYQMSAKTPVCGEGSLEIYRSVGPQSLLDWYDELFPQEGRK